jgi:hypothetical protein
MPKTRRSVQEGRLTYVGTGWGFCHRPVSAKFASTNRGMSLNRVDIKYFVILHFRPHFPNDQEEKSIRDAFTLVILTSTVPHHGNSRHATVVK